MIGLRTDKVRDRVGSRRPRAAARWLLGACLLWAGSTSAETTLEDLARCKATTGDAERLACYDALRKAAAPAAAAAATAPSVPVAAPEPAAPAPAPPRAPIYEPLTITDIRLDGSELKGRRVQVTGALM